MVCKTPQTARVIRDYVASDPEPLVISTGEKMRVGENDTKWPVFVRCWNDAGSGGWVPQSFIERDGETGVAHFDYTSVELTAMAVSC